VIPVKLVPWFSLESCPPQVRARGRHCPAVSDLATNDPVRFRDNTYALLLHVDDQRSTILVTYTEEMYILVSVELLWRLRRIWAGR